MNIINSLSFRINRILIKKYWRQVNKDNFTNLGIVSNPAFISFVKNGGISVGKKTYGVLNVHYSGNADEKLIIGAYCSISGSCHFLLGGEHDYSTISTYPFRSRILKKGTEVLSKGKIIVENEVWIGDAAWIMSGVRLGKGAVVATGAIVTRDVPPYAIVAGCPAKVIKYRFSDEIIRKLCNFEISNICISEEIEDLLNTHITEENVDYILERLKRYEDS